MSVAKKIVAILLGTGCAVTALMITLVWTSAQGSLVTQAEQKVQIIVRESLRNMQQFVDDAVSATMLLARIATVENVRSQEITLPSSIQSIQLVDVTGRIAGIVPSAQHEDEGLLPYVQELARTAITSQQVQFGQVMQDSSGNPVLYIAAPTDDVARDMAVVARMHWVHFQALLYRIDAYKLRLFADDKTLLAYSDTQDAASVFTREAYEEIYPVREAVEGADERIAASYTDTIAGVADEAWTLVAFISREEALSQQFLEVQRLTFFAGILLAVCIILIIQLLYIVVIRPLRRLTQVTQTLAEGNLRTEAVIESADEFGALARAFNTMARKIQATYTGLEEAVATRTKELKEKVEELEVTEKSLQAEKAKDDALFASITDGIVVVDARGYIQKVNTAATQLMDQHDTVLVGHPWYDFVDLMYEQEVVDPSDSPTNYAFKGTVVTSTVYALRTRSGRVFDVAFSAAPMFLAGKIIGVMIVFRDISKEREVERTKTEFITLASHQLRTPLSAANWHTELLLAGDVGALNTEQQSYVKEVYVGIQRMIRLVNALLQLSNFEMGAMHVENKTTADIKKTIDEIIDEVDSTISEKQIALTVSHATQTPTVAGDHLLLGIVIQTIIDNAVKYTPEHGQIVVTTAVVPAGKTVYGKQQAKKSVVLSVQDSGYGIPQSERVHIFEKFYRASNIKEHSADGNGLGLYLAHGIITQLHGEVWFDSEEGKGTTFYVSFPCA